MKKKQVKKTKKAEIWKPPCPDCGKTSGMYIRRDGGILAGSWACTCGWTMYN